MEANGRTPSIRSAAPYAIIAAIVLAFFWFSLKNPSWQVAEMSGVIEAGIVRSS